MESIILYEDEFSLEQRSIQAHSFGIPYWLLENLSSLSFSLWMPIQSILIPRIMERSCDILANAPTGSGKTLSYLVPIIATLHTRTVPAIRALIIVPTRDLAFQIYKLALWLTKGSSLKISLLVGGHSTTKYSDEQHSISYSVNAELVDCYPENLFHPVDIIVATPGRLLDHLNLTRGFHLGHLQYLVIDEVDRVLDTSQSQEWIKIVHQSIDNPENHWTPTPSLVELLSKVKSELNQVTGILDPNNGLVKPIRVTKLLFSATVTKNPLKLSLLHLENLKVFSLCSSRPPSLLPSVPNSFSSALSTLEAIPKYQVSSSLEEYFFVVKPEHKPAHLLTILRKHANLLILVFVKSVEATEKLWKLLKYMDPNLSIDFISSTKNNTERKRGIKKMERRELRALICSDALSRGINISNIDCVINYDAPTHARTYIHRVGRTARAGKTGIAYTILSSKEARFHKEMMKKINRTDRQVSTQIAMNRITSELAALLKNSVAKLST